MSAEMYDALLGCDKHGVYLCSECEAEMNKPCEATPDATLEEQVMSHSIPKSEREHWAQREIERLRKELQEHKDVLKELSGADVFRAFEKVRKSS
jgi:hypothetical protein